MSIFHYSDDERKVNKVLKMNLDLSSDIQCNEEIASVRNHADENIASSIALLNSLGKTFTHESSDNCFRKPSGVAPSPDTWDSLSKQAERLYSEPVSLEDIFSEAEINSAFTERDEIDRLFSQKTGIVNKTDLAFLFVATALQVAKSLLFPHIAEKIHYGESFNPEERLAHNDKSIEDAHRTANDNFRDEHLKKHGTGHWINILYQTVPYDITAGSKDLGINMGGKYHRLYTLGHDAILGWIFGTANILTDCITFQTYQTNRVQRFDPITGKKKMWITPDVVSIPQLFQESIDMARADKLNLPAALFTQAQHLKSDEFTKLGLPVPVLATFNEEFASKLYKENYDALCFSRDVKIVGSSFVVSKLFDIIIGLLHGLFRTDKEHKDLYEVRTRKILLISNTLASSSSVIQACITKNPKNLDIGGLLNALTHLFGDIRFIRKIKQEFISSEISSRLTSELYTVDELFTDSFQ